MKILPSRDRSPQSRQAPAQQLAASEKFPRRSCRRSVRLQGARRRPPPTTAGQQPSRQMSQAIATTAWALWSFRSTRDWYATARRSDLSQSVARERVALRCSAACDFRIMRQAQSRCAILRTQNKMLVERLDAQNFCAVIVASPKRHWIGRIVDEDAADIGRPRQKIFDRLPAPRVEPQHAIARHAAAP
jgi:hypothetical protein